MGAIELGSGDFFRPSCCI